MKTKVFVYGTLMSGMRANHLLGDDAELVGYGVARGYDLYDLGPYPAAVQGDGVVYGEIWEVDSYRLPLLDYYESVGELYERRFEIVQTESETVQAWIYAYIRCPEELMSQTVKCTSRWHSTAADDKKYAWLNQR